MRNIDWNDKKKFLASVTQNGWVLQYASEKLQNDKDVVLDAINKDVDYLKYASHSLQNDIAF